MSEFTPGPWVLASEKDCFEEYVGDTRGYYAISQNPEIQIHDPIPPDRFMDAYLIAAAPDLLAALEGLIDEQNGPPLVKRESQWQEAMVLARAAIKKARGE